MERSILIIGTMVALLVGSPGEPGVIYRFQSSVSSGTVWVVGEDARLEVDPAESGSAPGRVVIWKTGGKQRFLLDAKESTYFDQEAYLAGRGIVRPSVDTLNVGAPFVVADVGKIRVDVQPSAGQQVPRSDVAPDCRPVVVRLSYDLKLRLKTADVSIPGRVEASGEYCLSESLPISRLPFRHGLEIVSGIPKVDALVAERLSTLKGVPVRSTLTVKRQIEGGEEVSATSTLVLSDFRTAEIPLDRFAVPNEFRYQEPVIVGPVRQEK